MWKKVAFISLGLWVLTVGAFLYLFFVGTGTKVDNRVEIALLPGERELILGEMRQLLEGVRGIIGGLGEGDREAVIAAASGNGMAMAQDVNPALITKLPKEFKQLGMNTHRRFDELASRSPEMSDKEILTETHAIMGSCVGCHVSYKITER
jgi:hypothetical protein